MLIKDRVKCEHCGSSSPVKHRRLDPRNLRSIHALLCRPCGTKNGFTPVSHDRAPANFATTSF